MGHLVLKNKREHRMKYTATLKDRITGYQRDCPQLFDYQDDERGTAEEKVIYQWVEGNGACDCSRADFLWDRIDADVPCNSKNDTRRIDLLQLVDEGGRVVWSSVKKNVHTSDIRRFKSCRRAWHFESPLRLNKSPKQTPYYFARGRAWHVALAEWYTYPETVDISDAFETAFRKDIEGEDWFQDQVSEMINAGRGTLPLYTAWAKQNDDFEVLPEFVERRGEVSLTDDINFTFRVDQIVRRRDGRLWLHDFKTTKTLPKGTVDYLFYDEQITGYLAALSYMLDEPVAGAIFTYLKSELPARPRLLKNGKLSTAKNMNVPAEVYYQEILKQGLDPSDYVDHLRLLKQNCSLFTRVEVYRDRKELSSFWESLKEVATLMSDPDVLIYPSPSQLNCNRCSFKDPCSLTNQGRSISSIMLNNYREGSAW